MLKHREDKNNRLKHREDRDNRLKHREAKDNRLKDKVNRLKTQKIRIIG